MIPFHVMVVAILVARGVGALAWLPIEFLGKVPHVPASP